MNFLLLTNQISNVITLTVLIILGALLLLLAICFLITYVIFKKAFGRDKNIATETNPIYEQYREFMKQGAEWFLALKPEKVTITSKDGLKLSGLFYETENARGTVIFMHGYHGNPTHDFGPVLPHFKAEGYSLLLPDQRAHGESEGKYLTFGVKESEDCLLWAKYVAKRFPKRSISLHGISMGGATVAMASCLEDLPEEVKLIANDCGFTSPDEIISSVRKSMKLPKFPFQYFVRFLAKTLAKFSLKEKNSSDCYAKSKLPALFIHGEEDNFVPYYMGKENYQKSSATDKILISVKGAGHGLAYITEPERVRSELTEFYNKHM